MKQLKILKTECVRCNTERIDLFPSKKVWNFYCSIILLIFFRKAMSQSAFFG